LAQRLASLTAPQEYFVTSFGRTPRVLCHFVRAHKGTEVLAHNRAPWEQGPCGVKNNIRSSWRSGVSIMYGQATRNTLFHPWHA
ncbi:MAG: hypothetical protein V3R68_03915, partial [Gammaproteobacteria bacterium]